jgi:hypothetical protein
MCIALVNTSWLDLWAPAGRGGALVGPNRLESPADALLLPEF